MTFSTRSQKPEVSSGLTIIVKPTMYRCSTVTKAELEQLKRVKNIVRKGRVKSISNTEIVLEHGSIATSLETLHIDCAGDGLARDRPLQFSKVKKSRYSQYAPASKCSRQDSWVTSRQTIKTMRKKRALHTGSTSKY